MKKYSSTENGLYQGHFVEKILSFLKSHCNYSFDCGYKFRDSNQYHRTILKCQCELIMLQLLYFNFLCHIKLLHGSRCAATIK